MSLTGPRSYDIHWRPSTAPEREGLLKQHRCATTLRYNAMRLVYRTLVRLRHGWMLTAAVCLICWLTAPDCALAGKRKKAPVVPPELKITSVAIDPATYVPGDGTLNFTIEIELPKNLGGDLLLEVSALISSPSMRSMRFLSARQTVEKAAQGISTASSPEAKPRTEMLLMWDGMDQSKELVRAGTFEYEIRAKLLTVSENGARTHMNAWPKRGVLRIE